MNLYNFFKSTKGNRDEVFKTTLNLFEKKPINILEIGAIRDFSPASRFGDGWSTYFFMDYVEACGGELTIVDKDEGAIMMCEKLVEIHPLKRHVKIINDLGINQINDSYDLVYLDGGNDVDEMLAEYEKCNKSSLVLCDDFNGKGTLLEKKHDDFYLFAWENNPHTMALYHSPLFGKKILKPIATS